MISYSSVFEAVDQCLNSVKIPEDLKQEAQNICCVVQSIVEEEDKNEIVSTLNAVSIFKQVTLGKWQRSSKKIQYLSWYISESQLATSQKHWQSQK